MKGCFKGCLIMFGVPVFLILFMFVYGMIEERRYRKDPPCARPEIVQAFACGVGFPPYELKDYKLMHCGFLPDFIDTVMLRFKEVPDSLFYIRLDSLCYVVTEAGTPWEYKESDGTWRYTFPDGCSRDKYPEYRNELIRNGVPEDFVTGHDLIYEIWITRDTSDWTIIYGEY